MSSLNKCLRKAGKLVSAADREELKALRQQMLDDGLSSDRANEQAVEEYLDSLELERLQLLDKIEAAGGDLAGILRPALFSRSAAVTAQPQRKADNPEGRPPAPASEPVQPIPSHLTQEDKYQVARQLAEENQELMAPIIENIKWRLGLEQADTDIKSFESAMGKANRAAIIEGKSRPWWNMEHLRDVFRMKASLDSLEQMQTILTMLNNEMQPYGGLDIVKTDTGKMSQPGPFGWRMVAFDVRMPNGQIVEFYMAPTHILEAADESHALYERWRGRDLGSISRRERARMERDMRAGAAMYEQAWQDFIGDQEAELLASLSSLEALAESVTSRKSSARSSMVTAGTGESQLPSASRNAVNEPSRTTTRESSLASNITEGSVPLFSRAEKGPEQDPLGFFSGLKRAAMALRQAKGSPQQMIQAMRNFGGVKDEELEWTGLNEFLAYRETEVMPVTKDEIVEFIANNGVKVTEYHYGANPKATDIPINFSWDADFITNDNEPDWTERVFRSDEGEVFTLVTRPPGSAPGGTLVEVGDVWAELYSDDGSMISSEITRDPVGWAEREARDILRADHLVSTTSGASEYGEWTLEGGDQYREIVLTLPVRKAGVEDISPSDEAAAPFMEDWNLYKEQYEANEREIRDYPARDASAPGMRLYAEMIDRRHELERLMDEVHAKMVAKQIEMGIPPPIGKWSSGHFDRMPPGQTYLAHFRLKDRIGQNGERVLFVEEIQSDLHQRGRKQGYLTFKDKRLLDEINERWKEQQKLGDKFKTRLIQMHDTLGYDSGEDMLRDIAEHYEDWATRWDVTHDATAVRMGEEWIGALQAWQIAKGRANGLGSANRVPDAPFKNNAWVELVAKRIIRMAVEGGYDQVAWTTGAQQGDRYNLRKFIEALEWIPTSRTISDGTSGTLYAYDKNSDIVQDMYMSEDKLADHIGEELAQKLLAGKEARNEWIEALIETTPRFTVEVVSEGEGEQTFYVLDKFKERVPERIAPPTVYDEEQTRSQFRREHRGIAEARARRRNEEWAEKEYREKNPEGMVVSGVGLETGGEGMKQFYDRTLPNIFKKMARKLDKGSQVAPTKVQIKDPKPLEEKDYTRISRLRLKTPPMGEGYTYSVQGWQDEYQIWPWSGARDTDVARWRYQDLQQVLPPDLVDYVQDNIGNVEPGEWLDIGPETLDPIYDMVEYRQNKMGPATYAEEWGLNLTPAMKEKALEEGQPLFSIPEPTGDKASIGQIKISLAPAIRALVGKVQVEIVQSATDVPGTSIPGDVEGVWYEGTDTVYLVADNLHDVTRAKAVMTHEVFGHLAMEELPEFHGILASIKNLKSMGNAEILRAAEKVARTQGPLNSTREAKEILAVMVEDGVQSNIVNQAILAIRNLLRRLGLNLEYTEAEIKELVIRAARGLQAEAAAKRAVLANMPLQEQILTDPRTVEQAIYAALTDVYPNNMQDMTILLHRELEAISGTDDPMQQQRANDIRQVLYRMQIAPTADPDVIDPDALYSRAFHGSGADFNRFDIRFIGSGEGNQAYGWGLYFSSLRNIAEWYRDKGSRMTWLYNGKEMRRRDVVQSMAKDITKATIMPSWVPSWAISGAGNTMSVSRAIVSMVARGGDVQAEIDNQIRVRNDRAEGMREYIELAKKVSATTGTDKGARIKELEEDLDQWELVTEYWKAGSKLWQRANEQGPSGVLYEVEIPDDENMLDFNELLNDQPDAVREILEEVFPELFETQWVDGKGHPLKDGNELWAMQLAPANVMKGSYLYEAYVHMSGRTNPEAESRPKLARLLPGFAGVVEKLSYDKQASLFFRDIGIPGHAFIGASSKERNYVVYDDSVIDIVEKDTGRVYSRSGDRSKWRGVGRVGNYHIRQRGSNDYVVTQGADGPIISSRLPGGHYRQQAEAWQAARDLHERGDMFGGEAEAVEPAPEPERPRGPVSEDQGNRGPQLDLFARQRDLFSRSAAIPGFNVPNRVVSDDPEIERIISQKFATPLEDMTLMDRMRSMVQRVKNVDWLNIKQSVVDSAASVEALERGLYGGQLLDASESAYKAVLATRNLGSVMAAVMHAGIPVYRNGVFEPRASRKGLVEIFEKITQHQEGNLLAQWELYAAAVRSSRLIGEENIDGTSREKLLSPAEIEKGLSLAVRYPVFAEVHGEWQKFNEQLLDLAIKTGVINGEEAKIWRRNDYVPFYRAMEDVEYQTGQGPRPGGGVANVRSGIKRLYGSDKPLGNIFENMVMNTAYLIDAVYKNTAMQRIVAMSEGIALMKEPMAWEKVPLEANQIARALLEAGLLQADGNTMAEQLRNATTEVLGWTNEQREHWVKVFRRVAPRGDNVVHVLQNGKPVYYRVEDPLLLRSIAAMGAQPFKGVMGLFRFAKRTLTSAVTIDPAFMAANFIRDTLSTWVVADHGKSPQFLAALKGAAAAWKQDEDTIQLMMAGAGGGGFYDHNPEDVRKMLAKKMPKGEVNAFANSILTPRGLWRFWQKVGNASEQANRVAVYRRVLAEGGTVAEAAYQARDVLNFTMSGDGAAMKFLVQTVPFLNARVQGLYRLYRGGAENLPGFAMKGTMIMAATMALLLKNEDDDRYQELPEWDKDTYWHFFIGDEHFRLPKPFEVGALFGTIPERAYRLTKGDDDWGIFTDRMWRMAMDTFSFNPVPQLVKPIAEQYFNRNMFTGNPIIGLMHEGLEPEAQYDPWTSETLRTIAAAMPDFAGEWVRSPKRLEAAIRGYFGTVGLYALGAADAVTRRALGHPDRPQRALQDYPVITRFWRNPQPRTSKYANELYDMLHEADAVYKTLNAYRNQHRLEEYQELYAEGKSKLATRKYLHAVASDVRKLNEKVRQVQYHPTMSPEEKRATLDKLNARRLALLQRVAKVSDVF